MRKPGLDTSSLWDFSGNGSCTRTFWAAVVTDWSYSTTPAVKTCLRTFSPRYQVAVILPLYSMILIMSPEPACGLSGWRCLAKAPSTTARAKVEAGFLTHLIKAGTWVLSDPKITMERAGERRPCQRP